MTATLAKPTTRATEPQARVHRLADGRPYGVSFETRLPGLGQVEVFSQAKDPRTGRPPRTRAVATLADGRRIDATEPLGTTDPRTARRILTRQLAPQLRRKAARR